MWNKSESNGVPKNINPNLQGILDQCRKNDDLPGQLKAALRDKHRSM